MKVIIAGSRTLSKPKYLESALTRSGIAHQISEVVSGGAKGVDTLGALWAAEAGIPIKQFLPNWKEFGKSAGPIRNDQMAAYADALIVIWDGKSRGTRGMISYARDRGLKIYYTRLEFGAVQDVGGLP